METKFMAIILNLLLNVVAITSGQPFNPINLPYASAKSL